MILKGDKGFTLIEMLIVMLVITVLLLIMIPNVLKHNTVINNKGCSALVKTVEAEVQVYELENGEKPSLEELEAGGYLKEGTVCPNGQAIQIDGTGKVTASGSSYCASDDVFHYCSHSSACGILQNHIIFATAAKRHVLCAANSNEPRISN